MDNRGHIKRKNLTLGTLNHPMLREQESESERVREREEQVTYSGQFKWSSIAVKELSVYSTAPTAMSAP